MNTRRFGLRVKDSRIPTVEVTDSRSATSPDGARWEPVVAYRARGFTRRHAFKRAFKWASEHGDARYYG